MHCTYFSDVPKLPPLPRPGEENEEDDDDEDSKEDKPKKQRKLSGPKAIDPYANDESSMLIPIAVAIAVFLPTLFCLCKLWQPTVGWFYLFHCKLHIKCCFGILRTARKPWGNSHVKRSRMLVISCKGINLGLWPDLGYWWCNTTFLTGSIFQGALEETNNKINAIVSIVRLDFRRSFKPGLLMQASSLNRAWELSLFHFKCYL